MRIWHEAKDIGGTLAAQYLAHRKLVLPPGMSGRVLRFHPNCPFGVALLALYTGIRDNVPRALHRTALTRDGLKLGPMALGPKAVCAIKLTADEDARQWSDHTPAAQAHQQAFRLIQAVDRTTR